MLVRKALAIALILMCAFSRAAVASETVVILHGIARTNKSMKSIETALQKEQYETLNITYPSTEHNLNDIAKHLFENELNTKFWESAEKVHFVTHSMGGLVARKYLEMYKDKIPAQKLGNVVMLGPPNGGSEVADWAHSLWPYQWFYGPAGQELTTAAAAVNSAAPYYPLGIIAGTREWPYFVAAFVVPGDSDGRVSVEKTKLPGMTDHMSLVATHTFIMDDEDAHRQVVYFLKNKMFERAE
jgi:pimeloyl-ACP methyl ester carboxylesterase